MYELLRSGVGENMSREEYLAEFWQRFWQVDSTGFWKLEREQHFREQGYPVWEAFARGEWDESLRLLEEDRAAIAAEHRRMKELGITVSWVRVVEQPLTAYMHWNLRVLRVREQCGSRVRVVRPEHVAHLEATRPMPELVTVGAAVMYELHYDDTGALEGARRYIDRELTGRCRRIIAELHAAGEPLRH